MQEQAAATPAPAVAPVVVQVTPPAGNPNAIYRGYQARREELANQLERYTDTRGELVQQLERRQGDGREVSAVSRAGIEARIVEVDKQIQAVEKQLTEADLNVARTVAVPGAVLPPRPPQRPSGPPEEFFVIAGIFMFVCVLPISFAYARRIWRRSAGIVTSLPTEIVDRLTRLDQAVDSIAVEVERIGEGQRFVTRVMSERGHSLGAGPAQPLEAVRGEKARVGERGL